jgi:hypothetical protein
MEKGKKEKAKKGRKARNQTAQNGTNWKPSSKQIALVELLINPEDRRTKADKCEDAGVPRRTFYRWLKDEKFINYMNSQLDKYTNSELPEVWKALMMQCKRGNVNAIKLFFEMKELVPAVKVKQEHSGPNGGPIEAQLTWVDLVKAAEGDEPKTS